MYNVLIVFTDRYERDYYNINKIEYYSGSECITIENDAILTTKFPLTGIYYMYADDSIYVVNLQDAVSLEITC